MSFNRSRPIDRSLALLIGKSPDIAGMIARTGLCWTHVFGDATAIDVESWTRYEGLSYAVI